MTHGRTLSSSPAPDACTHPQADGAGLPLSGPASLPAADGAPPSGAFAGPLTTP